ncbi:beta-ketoacyl-[acyl-carrier-protein] synthase family protein [Cyclobacterium xiamenense]|nr:hypothetical protein [Cyclobacterium xiamenense]
MHTGGKNMLTAFEKALALSADQLRHSHETLAQYGNKSSVTILFVLERMLRYANTDGAAVSKSIYAAAFGPGVSLESALIRLHDPKK